MTDLQRLDEAWLRAARQRAAAGQWERDPDSVFGALESAPRARPVAANAPRCPSCPGRPSLAAYHRRESPAPEPLWCCDSCHGAWASSATLALGLDESELPPFVFAGGTAAACRSCGGALRPAGDCPDCGLPPPRPCPACDAPMAPQPAGPVHLDACEPCRGTWFDVGELAALFGLSESYRPAAGAMATGADEATVPRWQVALDVVFALLLPHLRLGRFR